MEANYKIREMPFIGFATVGHGWKNEAYGGLNRMYYIKGGTGGYIEKGKKIPFVHGKMYFLPFYSNFVLYNDIQDNLSVTYTDFKLTTPVISSTVYCISPEDSPCIASAINTFNLLCLSQKRSETETEYLKNTVTYLVNEAVQAQPQKIINDEVVVTALDYIHSNLSQKISISDIAQKCFMSTDGFIRRFTRHVREPPYSYLRRLRLRTAMAMRAEGKVLSEIAEACGYSDASALLHAVAATQE
ncbi:MAG: helix-turn-helix domain-containing protein [Clostridia bacterium]|nr:helix-turn-helix domain-containing protein [Clostridia bacterium]